MRDGLGLPSVSTFLEVFIATSYNVEEKLPVSGRNGNQIVMFHDSVS